MSKRAAVSILGSVVVHGLMLGIAFVPYAFVHKASTQQAHTAITTGALRRYLQRLDTARRREALVERARSELAKGSLQLGAFLLEANQIDALDADLEYDATRAEKLYQERVAALRGALGTRQVPAAIPEVFGDLRYHGRPGGLMGEALLQRGGSCEQLSLLIVAASYDSGRPEVALRFYGGAGREGVAHVTPVWKQGDREVDLVAGKDASKGGVRVQALQLVEIYARAYGLAPPVGESSNSTRKAEAGGAGESSTQSYERPSLIAGFPPNGDVFPSELPLYAARAIKPPGDKAETNPLLDPLPVDPAQDARRCGYYLRMAVLDPLLVHAYSPSSTSPLPLEPRRAPHPNRLETESALLRNAWQVAEDRNSNEADRLMGYACVAALGEVTALDFSLSGEHELGREAMAKAKAAKRTGDALAGAWSKKSDAERAELRSQLADHAGRTWLLLLLQGGEGILLDLIERSAARGWGKISSLAGLVVWPATRDRALVLLERYPLDDQVDVMHEIYHAHDHMAPWASDFDWVQLPAGGRSSPFLAAWRVFRGLGWRLWNGRRPVEEMLSALHDECVRAGLESSWEAAFLEYAARNTLGLAAMRSPDLLPVRQLRAAVARNGSPSLALLARRLAFLEAKGELTGPTLADAWELQ